VGLSLANSICWGWWMRGLPLPGRPPFTASMNQLYSGRWSSNSSVQIECVMPSMESSNPCAQSYIG
jgi:hypothetical protein